jgi:hypothetical protein
MVKVGGGVRETPVLLHWVPVDFVSKCIVCLTRRYGWREEGSKGREKERKGREERVE